MRTREARRRFQIAVAAGCALAFFACQKSPGSYQDTSADMSADADTGGSTGGSTGGATQEPWEVPWQPHACEPGTFPEGSWTPTNWTAHSDDPSCTHVAVEAKCEDGWCEIPAGCFVSGPKPEEYGAPIRAVRATVHLTHSFVIQQAEFSLGQWLELGFARPVPYAKSQRPCTRDDCPATYVTWYAALEAANALSREEGLEECYALADCGPAGGSSDFKCASATLTTASAYECKGYRLPTKAEREYAARAGTQTTFYSGEVTDNGPSPRDTFCYEDPALIKVAWYCFNTQHTQPSRCREPNRWGLYDMLGNVGEWASLGDSVSAGPLTDPDAVWSDSKPDTVETMNGSTGSWPATNSSYIAVGTLPDGALGYDGFRLVRTLPD